MDEQNLRVVVKLPSRSDRVDETRNLLESLVEPSRKEDGCLSYELLQNIDDPTDFTVIETWEDGAAYEGHLNSPHVQRALPQLQELLAGELDIQQYHSLG